VAGVRRVLSLEAELEQLRPGGSFTRTRNGSGRKSR
jgi:hypothetical protein